MTKQAELRGHPKTKPILFSGPMVRALLDGRKTQTRRVLKPQPEPWKDFYLEGGCMQSDWRFDVGFYPNDNGDRRFGLAMHSAFHETRVQWLPYAPGDLFWVRETWASDQGDLRLRADGDSLHGRGGGKWRPSIFMPRWASRLTLRVTKVRVQRLQEISCADAIAEGIAPAANSQTIDCDTPDPRKDFRALWDSLNATRGFSWDVNPWVVAVSFEVIRENVNAVLKALIEQESE